MRLFNLFARKKKKTIKELYEHFLDKMWVCSLNFSPWCPDKYKVIFKEVEITEAHADKYGIWVKSNWVSPLSCSNEGVSGYIDRIEMEYNCCGFFETEDEAKKAYNKLMEEWIAVIRANMAKI